MRVCTYRRAAADTGAAKEELAVVDHDAGVPHALDLATCNVTHACTGARTSRYPNIQSVSFKWAKRETSLSIRDTGKLS